MKWTHASKGDCSVHRNPARSAIELTGLATLVVGLLFAGSASRASDWPTYRGDNARVGTTTDKLPESLELRWVYSAPSAPRLSLSGDARTIEGNKQHVRVRYDDSLQVAVVGDRVYFGSSIDHAVYCLDAKSRATIWKFYTGGPIRLAPTIRDGRAWFGSDDGHVYCVDAADGELVWKLRAGPADEWILSRGEMVSRWPVRTGVLVDGDLAYFGAGIFPHETIYLYAVKAADGAIVWRRDNISQGDAGRDDLSPQGYLLATDDLLFVPSGRSLPVAVDRKTGDVVYRKRHSWRRDAGGVIGGTRALLADDQLYAAGPLHHLCMDQKTGNVGFGWFDGMRLAIASEKAFALTGKSLVGMDRLAYAANSRRRHELEMDVYSSGRKLRGQKGDQARATEKKIADAKAELERITDGGILWKTPSDSEGDLIVAGNQVIAGGNDRVAIFAADSGKETWNAAVEGEATGLAVADDALFVSTTAGKIYCFAAGAAPIAQASKDEPNPTPYPEDDRSALYGSAAEEVLRRTGQTRGFCLVVGSETGRLAYELAKRSDLKIYGVEPDADKVETARNALSDAGLYGHRITIHQADPSAIPYSNYFANLIVSDTLLASGKAPADPTVVARHLKPLGGMIALGQPEGAPRSGASIETLTQWQQRTGLVEDEAAEVDAEGSWVTLKRGALPGAGNWSHQYGDAGNTASSEDTRVKGGLGVLWYGDPGPGKMVNRHDSAVGPLAVNGRLIVQGENSVMAYDAYNGVFLWERENPQSIRTGVFQNQTPGNLAASEDSVFVMMREVCIELDAATGELRATHRLPDAVDSKTHQWGYVAHVDGRLFGTATRREMVDARRRRRGRRTVDATDSIFAIDLASGKHLWSHQGKNIAHRTIALGPDQVYFIDSSISGAQREALLREDKSNVKNLTGKAAEEAEALMKGVDVRLAVALDAATGKQLWSKKVDVTDCSEIGIGGGKLTLMVSRGALILGGANANGHYWKQFVAGEFARRRLVALDAVDGSELWAKDANYRHRPIIVGDTVLAEPWAFDLRTGVQQMREHPVTGEQVPWSMMRTGHHCGMITGCPNMLLFRSGATGFYDLQQDIGIRHFSGHRLGCWINSIPANGLVMIPEASAGCVCLYSIAATIVMEPREPREPWAIHSMVGAMKPVRHLAVNLGAPGDRKDARGTSWITYPRPKPYQHTKLELDLQLQPKFLAGGGYESRNSASAPIEGTETPWVFNSVARGLVQCTVPLLEKNAGAGRYDVKLYFTETDPVEPGQRVFDVKLQGKTVLEDFDIVAAANGPSKAVVRAFPNISITDDLVIDLVPQGSGRTPERMPLISGIEVIRSSQAD